MSLLSGTCCLALPVSCNNSYKGENQESIELLSVQKGLDKSPSHWVRMRLLLLLYT